jgi:hypothetical protein
MLDRNMHAVRNRGPKNSKICRLEGRGVGEGGKGGKGRDFGGVEYARAFQSGAPI